MTIICLLIGMNTQVEDTNTLPTIRVMQTAHAENRIAIAPPARAPKNLQVLSSRDEALYRTVFAAQAQNDWQTADAAIAHVNDKGLMGHVLADRYDRRKASPTELKEWLAAYADLPEAQDIYDTFRDLPAAKGTKVQRPVMADLWTGEESYGTSFDFRVENNAASSRVTRRIEDKISRALHHNNPGAAEDLLFAEMEHRGLSSAELGEIQGRIAAGFFYAGATGHAHDVALKAMSSNNPLALWIAGLSAWKQNNARDAAEAFTKLAVAPGLSPSDRTAAEFWAWRALTRTGEATMARVMLDQAAKEPRNFYGMLASALVGRNTGWSFDLPTMNSRMLTVLAKSLPGWRALALIQIGRPQLAESELRRLNPQGHRDLQEAMLAVAETNHMPLL
ncbi:MAG: hypothetical protein M3N08_10260, partial [Pseudomonadota bacterium]|nr:hypothetical protein [Pseudomonadota bacterium]